jgi:hypothetical protein
MQLVSCDDILHLREKYRSEAETKGVTLIPQLTVLTNALEKFEPISVKLGPIAEMESVSIRRTAAL